MMEHPKRRLPWALTALGAAMVLCALAMLAQTPRVLQYCVLPPEAGEKGEGLLALEQSAQRLGERMKDTLAWTALCGADTGTSLIAGDRTEAVNLFAVGEGWFEVYPRFLTQGRRFGESELESGAAVIMLDEDLAFRLFGTDLPENAGVKLNNVDFRVIGTVRHAGSVFGGRGVGDAVAYDAYVPLAAAAKHGVPLEALTLSAVSQGGTGTAALFEEAAGQWHANGWMINLQKERMRRTVLPRIVLLIVGLYAMVGLFRWATRRATVRFEDFAQALKLAYLRQLIPRLVGLIALTLLIYGALIGATYLLMSFSVQPLFVFTEWVPENIVEWSSIAKVFWSLTAGAARLVRVGTRELRVVEFWGGVLRWGTVLALLGAALRGRRRE